MDSDTRKEAEDIPGEDNQGSDYDQDFDDDLDEENALDAEEDRTISLRAVLKVNNLIHWSPDLSLVITSVSSLHIVRFKDTPFEPQNKAKIDTIRLKAEIEKCINSNRQFQCRK
ncbi:hypothetical protein DSO57_1032454 [Entomophthora muscae]|uniref:Uncharacterized protein n=1 Tax=Entomophthora muscae TaxID=34485 RepID=A0ACC2RRJ1_9FUNG|nr:hypothetical protein DSO57_1032454 [Entomophthora muscae]